jgi:hypothetical protein
MKQAKKSSRTDRQSRRRRGKHSSALQRSLDEQHRRIAKYIAMVVRNAMEDFHVKHLNDGQMRELNPIIRNAVYTALHAMELSDSDPASASFVGLSQRLIPKYWEEPELLTDYLQTVECFRSKSFPLG